MNPNKVPHKTEVGFKIHIFDYGLKFAQQFGSNVTAGLLQRHLQFGEEEEEEQEEEEEE